MDARNWTYYGEDGPGPAFFPSWYGVALVALSLLLIVTAIRKGSETEAIEWPAVGRALGAWLAFAVCAGLMGWLGFLVSFAILTIFVVAIVFRQSLVKALVIAVCASAGFYLVFPFALSVPLPTGVFGF